MSITDTLYGLGSTTGRTVDAAVVPNEPRTLAFDGAVLAEWSPCERIHLYISCEFKLACDTAKLATQTIT